MRRFVQIATMGMCGNLNKKSCPFLNKDYMRPIYMLIHQFSLSSFCAQGQCCNLQYIYITSLQFIFSALRLLVVERVSTCQNNIHKIPFVLFSHTAGTRFFWCRRQSDLSQLLQTQLAVLSRQHCQPVPSGIVS